MKGKKVIDGPLINLTFVRNNYKGQKDEKGNHEMTWVILFIVLATLVLLFNYGARKGA